MRVRGMKASETRAVITQIAPTFAGVTVDSASEELGDSKASQGGVAR